MYHKQGYVYNPRVSCMLLIISSKIGGASRCMCCSRVCMSTVFKSAYLSSGVSLLELKERNVVASLVL